MEVHNILISESQERMLIVASKEMVNQIFEVFDKWDLEYADIGEITTTGQYTVYYHEKVVYTDKITDVKDIDEDWDININKEKYTDQIKKVKNMELWKVYDSTVGNRTIKGPDKSKSYSILDIYEINKNGTNLGRELYRLL